jgi:hypothetical protein
MWWWRGRQQAAAKADFRGRVVWGDEEGELGGSDGSDCRGGEGREEERLEGRERREEMKSDKG